MNDFASYCAALLERVHGAGWEGLREPDSVVDVANSGTLIRLLPGLVRTDEPVFNLPRLGKSNLRAWQDHEVIMILPDGRRMYRFYSWEVRLVTAFDYIYTDVSIYDYLRRLARDGENVNAYTTIWYHF